MVRLVLRLVTCDQVNLSLTRVGGLPPALAIGDLLADPRGSGLVNASAYGLVLLLHHHLPLAPPEQLLRR